MEINQPTQNLAPLTPNTQPINTPPPPTPEKKKAWLVVALALLILGATGVLGYKYYKAKQQPDDQPSTPQPSSQLIVNSPSPIVSSPPTTDPTADWITYQDTNMGVSFSFKYPSSWTYQKFSCNVDGVAFCPLIENSPSNCGQTCGMDSPISPIYLHQYQGKPAVGESDTSKYWADPNISLSLRDSKYKEVFTNIIYTFK